VTGWPMIFSKVGRSKQSDDDRVAFSLTSLPPHAGGGSARRSQEGVRAIRPLAIGSMLLFFAGMGSVLVWKISENSPRRGWIEEANKLEKPSTVVDLEYSLGELAALMGPVGQLEQEQARRDFLKPLKNFLRKEAQFPQLRLSEDRGCVLVSLSCSSPKGERLEHFGEALFNDKYEMAWAAYVALGSAIVNFRGHRDLVVPDPENTAGKMGITTTLLSQCRISPEGGVLTLEQARCQSSWDGKAALETPKLPAERLGSDQNQAEARSALRL
jgi:hypothetical protein